MAELATTNPKPAFAEIAVELFLAERSFAELSFAAAILSIMRADNLYRLDRAATEIGLPPSLATSILLDHQRGPALCAEAHRLFKRMIPHQAAIMKLIDKADREDRNHG